MKSLTVPIEMSSGASMPRQRILLFDPKSEGHHQYYLKHVLDYLSEITDRKAEYYLCTSQRLEGRINVGKYASVVMFIWMQPTDEFLFLKDIISTEAIDKVFFFDIENHIPTIRRLLKSTSVLFSGILLKPYCRIKDRNNLFFRLRTMRRWVLSLLNTYSLFRHDSWDRVFVLNDESAVERLNQLPFLKATFEYICDPLPEQRRLPGQGREKVEVLFPVRESTPVIICLGALDDRKNVIRVINCVKRLAAVEKQPVALIIAGRASPRYKEKIEQAIRGSTKAQIYYHDHFLPDDLFAELIAYSDILAIPYYNFFWSSGLLGHAVFHQKPVLAPNQGLIAEYVRTFELGVTVNPHSEKAILEGLKRLLKKSSLEEEKLATYREKLLPFPTLFAQKIVGDN